MATPKPYQAVLEHMGVSEDIRRIVVAALKSGPRDDGGAAAAAAAAVMAGEDDAEEAASAAATAHALFEAAREESEDEAPLVDHREFLHRLRSKRRVHTFTQYFFAHASRLRVLLRQLHVMDVDQWLQASSFSVTDAGEAVLVQTVSHTRQSFCLVCLFSVPPGAIPSTPMSLPVEDDVAVYERLRQEEEWPEGYSVVLAQGKVVYAGDSREDAIRAAQARQFNCLFRTVASGKQEDYRAARQAEQVLFHRLRQQEKWPKGLQVVLQGDKVVYAGPSVAEALEHVRRLNYKCLHREVDPDVVRILPIHDCSGSANDGFRVPVTIEGLDLSALVDTGADRTCIPHKGESARC